MFRQAPSFPYHDLGIVEDGNTASRAISKDAYVIWKGSSYFASTDILQGATLEEDVNLTAIPDGVINGVADALDKRIMSEYTLLASGNSGGDTNVTLSESMTNFRWLYITNVTVSGTYGNIYTDMALIPVSLLRSADCGGFGSNGYATARTYCFADYVSDTVVYLQRTGGYRIYGIN